MQGASLVAAAVTKTRPLRPARGGVFLAKIKEGAVADKRGKAIKVTVLTHIRAGKFYKANGKREVARRLRQMVARGYAWFNETTAMTPAQWESLRTGVTRPGDLLDTYMTVERSSRYDADLVSA